jgi:hypothetical protein
LRFTQGSGATDAFTQTVPAKQHRREASAQGRLSGEMDYGLQRSVVVNIMSCPSIALLSPLILRCAAKLQSAPVD